MQHPPEHTPPAAPRRTLRQAFNWRTLKYGSHASLFTVIVLAVVYILYSLAVQHNRRFDVTQAKRFTLAEQSVKLVQGLQYPIKSSAFTAWQSGTVKRLLISSSSTRSTRTNCRMR